MRRRARAELVLLVDDDPDVRQVSVEMLRDLGYEVAEAAGGEEALDTVRRLPAPPALLVLDYAMPGMNGLRLAAALRAMGIDAPLLLATGYAELSDDQSGVTPDAILHKPFSLAELDRTLLRLRTRPRKWPEPDRGRAYAPGGAAAGGSCPPADPLVELLRRHEAQLSAASRRREVLAVRLQRDLAPPSRSRCAG